MFAIREIDEGTNKVTHVWFLVKDLYEEQEIILKRCFGHDRRYHETRGIYDHWVSGYYGLWHDKRFELTDWTLENEIGPEIVKRYIVTVED